MVKVILYVASFWETSVFNDLSTQEKNNVRDIVARRESNKRFLQQTLNYTTPSYVTLPFIGALGEP
jgi:hypothetical protein